MCTPLPLPREATGPKAQIDAAREKKKTDLMVDLGPLDFAFPDLGRQSKYEVSLNGIPPEVVITFVETIETAYHYFYFRDYLIRNTDKIQYCSRPDAVFANLSRTRELKAVFDKVDKFDLSYLVRKHISKLKERHEADMIHQYAEYLETCEFITTESDMEKDLEEIIRLGVFSALSYNQRAKFLMDYKVHIILTTPFRNGVPSLGTTFEPSPRKPPEDMKFRPFLRFFDQEEPDEAFINPIYKMVYDSLKGVCTLDVNPGVELERLKRSQPHFYNEYIVHRIPPLRCSFVPSMAVFVTNLPSNVNEKAIEEFFSDCDKEKATVKIRRRNESGPQAACVTFETIDGQEKALLKQNKFENNIVEITAVPGHGVPFKTVQTREIGAAEDLTRVLGKVEDDGSRNVKLLILHQVLEKYWLYSEKRL